MNCSTVTAVRLAAALMLIVPAVARAQDASALPPPPAVDALPPPPQIEPPRPVARVRIFAGRGMRNGTDVSVDGVPACKLPCTLDTVAPGPHDITVGAPENFTSEVEVPFGESMLQAKKLRGNRLKLGIFGVAGGVTLIVVGALLYSSYNAYSSESPRILGGLAMGAGVAFGGIAGGIGFGTMYSGEIKVTPYVPMTPTAPTAAPTTGSKVKLVGLAVAPAPRGAMAGATFAF